MQSYPLDWPPGWPRVRSALRARFGDKSLNKAISGLMHELSLLGARDVVISTNLAIRKSDGLPKSGQRQPDDRAVAVYFNLNKKAQCIPCDKWTTIEDNIWAIKKTVEALRGLERWGAKEMVNAAFTGFKALPESGIANTPYWEVLGIDRNSNLFDAEDQYKRLAFINHPDKGGDPIKMSELNGAIKQARQIYE